MKNQIVYVVTDKASDTIVGVFNDYKNAKKVAFKWQEVKDSREEEVAVTPVAVDVTVDVPSCYTFEELEKTLSEVFDVVQRVEFEDDEEVEDEEIAPEVFEKVDEILDSLYDDDEDEEDDIDWDAEEEEEDWEDEDEKNEEYFLTPKGEFFLKLLDSGIDYDEALKIADIIFDRKEDGE